MPESQSTVYEPKNLFGGSIVCSLPTNFLDVSKIRQIPDTQECFLERDGYTSIIFDILARVGGPGTGPEVDGPALTCHIKEIVGDADSEQLKVWNTTVTKITRLPEDISAYTLIATTPPGNNNGGTSVSDSSGTGAPSLVFTALILTLIRLENIDTDIVVTINVPHIKGEYIEEDVDLELGQRGRLIGRAVEHAAKIWESFAIKNLGLFGSQFEGKTYGEL